MNLKDIKSIKLSKTWLVLIVAVVIGAIAAFSASSFLSGRLADIEAQKQGKTVNTVVAKRDLLRGETLSSDNVAVRSIPADYAQSGAVAPEQFGSIEGEALGFDLKAGEMLMWSQLEGKKVPTFSTRIESGRRAITVAVDEINSISGLLEPGDLIDLLVTVDQQGKKTTVPLLQGVRVMATGQRSVDDPQSGEKRMYSTVTLNTDPLQAQTVVVAREAGRLTALLRNPQDNTPLQSLQGDLTSILGQRNTPAAASSTLENALPAVPVLYGGTSGGIPPEGLHLGQYAKARSLEQQAQASEAAFATAALADIAQKAANDQSSPAPAPTVAAPREVPVMKGGSASRAN
jgi:pilus assembly protein CpaB